MAKKTRRPNLPQDTLERARRELERGGTPVEQPAHRPSQPTSPAKASTPVPPKAGPRISLAPKVTTEDDLRVQYAYVISDLENMALVAAAILVTLVILSFFI
jgi:hypothetical protein